MDRHTRRTKKWLETQRFTDCDERGIYIPHQPIYGFQHHRGKPEIIGMYLITYQIMRALSCLNFETLVDIGGAEGYTAYIAKQLFGAKVVNSDLSEEACKRAEEIFDIKSIPADIHDLPFENNEFDVALCSETLEHVSDWHKAVNELLRITKKAVVITVPYETQEVVDKNIEEEIPHAHIHCFDLESFNYLKKDGYHILSKKMMSPWLRIPAILIEAVPIKVLSGKSRRRGGHPKILLNIYNAAIPILRKFLGKKAAAFLIRLSEFICKFTSSYGAVLFIIFKDKKCLRKGKIRKISPLQIINFKAHYYYLKSIDKSQR